MTLPDKIARTVKTLQAAGGLKRVRIVERSDGVYRLAPEEWYRSIDEGKLIAEGWKPIYEQFGLFGDVASAEREAISSFDWLSVDSRSGD
ncbi:hypothetical protein FY156_06890 [Agrobacterium tumefaciens]|nr:hypothetical protein FY156_06890 [Agrobacterium tumefaciens]